MIVPVATCRKCGYNIFGRDKNDMRFCLCQDIWIEGGPLKIAVHYKKDKAPPIVAEFNMVVSRAQLRRDFETQENKYGSFAKPVHVSSRDDH